MAAYTPLKGVKTVNDALQSDQLEANLMGWLNWSMLGCAGFFNVSIPTSGVFGGNENQLRAVDDPYYQPGQVWEAFRKDWVWETGVPWSVQPIRVSGVYINSGNLLPLSSGVHVDYPNGRIVLDTPISTASLVSCEYSYRLFQLYSADNAWWQEIQMQSFRIDSSQFLQQGSGAWDVLAQNRIQLPAVIVEAVPRVERSPFEIGNLVQITKQDVLFHILTEDRFRLKWMHDALTGQQEIRIAGFDKNLLLSQDAFPLEYDGSPKASGMMYPDLIQPVASGGFFWTQIRVNRMRSQEQQRMGTLHYVTVRGTFEMDLA